MCERSLRGRWASPVPALQREDPSVRPRRAEGLPGDLVLLIVFKASLACHEFSRISADY